MINGIRGWLFDEATLNTANVEGRLLTFDFELGEACPLRCVYCYRTQDSRDDDDTSAHHRKPLLSFESWKKTVDQAVELGAKSVKLIGGGEITEETHFREALTYMASKGLIVVLFTSGTVLGDEALCKQLYGISPLELARWMHDDLGMSVFLKMDAIDHDLQDMIVGVPGYAKIRDRALEVLIEAGFSQHDPTRLGLEVNVGRRNLHEIMRIYELRTKLNVYEDVVISMPCDVYFRHPDYDITIDEKKTLYRSIYEYNRRHDIPFSTVSPFMGGLECTQLGNGLYITNRGDVYHCPGTFERLGSLTEEPLASIWQRCKQREMYHRHYFCPFRENSGILPPDMVEEMEQEILGHQSARTCTKQVSGRERPACNCS